MILIKQAFTADLIKTRYLYKNFTEKPVFAKVAAN